MTNSPRQQLDEVQGFDDVEAFLTDYVPQDISEQADEQFEESEVAEILATTWKDKRQELAKLQRARKFTDANVARRSFRVKLKSSRNARNAIDVVVWAIGPGNADKVVMDLQALARVMARANLEKLQ